MDDQVLVTRAAEGDATAFELIVRRHAGDLFRLARSVLADDQLAEEAVQDSFVKAHRNLTTFRGDASLRTWLSSICYRTALDGARRRPGNVVPIDAARPDPRPHPDVELRLCLQEALGELPPDEREAFQLVHVLGYPREEAARIVGVPASTMRSRVARARERLALSLRTLEDSVTGGST